MNLKKLPISVNICSFNEEKDIGDCLDRVLANNPFEIIVIDGGSTDKTIEIVKSKGVSLIVAKQKGFASQRQEGLRASKMDHIAIIDADDHIEKNFLHILYEEMHEFGFDSIQARIETFEAKKYLEKAMGSTVYERKPAEEANIKFRRSVYFVKDISAGDVISKEHVRRIRPGYGLPPKFEQDIIGKEARFNIKPGVATTWDLINLNPSKLI